MRLYTMWFGSILTLVVLVLTACSNQVDVPTTAEQSETATALPALAKNSDGYADINITQLAAAMPGEEFTLVNVHIPYEGELPNTDLFIPFDEIMDYQDELPAKDAPIVLYCRSGNMSTDAAQVLADAGYTNVYELDGGFNAWRAAGYELLMNE